MKRTLLALPALLACAAPESESEPAEATPSTVPAQIAALSAPRWWVPPRDPSNRYADDPRAARLGQRFFFDARFSGPLLDSDNDGTSGALGFVGETGKVACASCHMPSSAFQDDRSHGKQISLAAGWGTRRAPSLLGVGHARLVMWDGRHDALYNQVFGPIEASFELNSSRLFVAQQIHRHYRAEYEAIFGPLPPLGDGRRFPALAPERAGCDGLTDQAVCHGRAELDRLVPEDQTAVTRVVVNMGKAIAAYERLLTCGPGRFDAWVAGDEAAVTDEEKRGAALFVGKGGCVRCHTGPLLTDQKFHNVGLRPERVSYGFVDENDVGAHQGIREALASPLNVKSAFSDGNDGRLPAAVEPGMLGAFRTPSLRCVSLRKTFMHTGQLRTLEGVVSFFDRGGDRDGYPGVSESLPLSLTDEEQAALVAFLGTLEGNGPRRELLVAP